MDTNNQFGLGEFLDITTNDSKFEIFILDNQGSATPIQMSYLLWGWFANTLAGSEIELRSPQKDKINFQFSKGTDYSFLTMSTSSIIRCGDTILGKATTYLELDMNNSEFPRFFHRVTSRPLDMTLSTTAPKVDDWDSSIRTFIGDMYKSPESTKNSVSECKYKSADLRIKVEPLYCSGLRFSISSQIPPNYGTELRMEINYLNSNPELKEDQILQILHKVCDYSDRINKILDDISVELILN